MTPEQRSRCMSHIRSKDTKPEMMVRKFLFSKGLRYRVSNRKLPGSPDIVLKKYKTVVFVNGCFWHGHEGCKYYRLPKTNVDFWQAKIDRNTARDAEVDAVLRAKGWRVIRIWECELKTLASRENTLEKTYLAIVGKPPYEETETEIPLAAEPTSEYGIE